MSRMKGTKFKIDWAEVKRMRAEMFASHPERRTIYEANVALSRPILDELREQKGCPQRAA